MYSERLMAHRQALQRERLYVEPGRLGTEQRPHVGPGGLRTERETACVPTH